MDRIAVLIPCYNESATIGKVVDDFKTQLPDAVIYVYDNNSTDDTDRIAAEHGAVVRYERRQGKGNVVRRMFREINAECYLMVDGDDTYSAENAADMCELVLQKQSDMVVGDRLSGAYYQENTRAFHNAGNSLVQKTINRLFDTDIHDILTGYRAFSYRFVKTVPVISGGFEIETEITIHAVDKAMQVDQVVVGYRDRPEGSVSKLNTIPDGIRVLGMLFRLYRNYRPGKFFGTCSAVLSALSIAFFIPVFVEYMKTGLVPKIPTLIVCGFVMLIAILSFFTGQILESVRLKSRQDFESALLRAEERFAGLIEKP